MKYTLLASLGLALVAAPAIAEAQQDTTRVRAEAGGEVERGVANRGLTQAQVRQLQQALRDAGCNPGAVDGQLGPATRQAMACARRQRGIEAGNANDLLRALNLGFTLDDSVSMEQTRNVAAAGEGTTPRYSDPTFVHDPGVMHISTDTMPAGLLENSDVFVRSSGSPYLREVLMERRTTPRVVPPRDSAPAARMQPAMPTMRDSMMRTDSMPRMRMDSISRMQMDSVQRMQLDRMQVPGDSLRLMRSDSIRTAVPDSTLRRMRDEILLELPPTIRTTRDSTQRADTTRRTPPDTTRTPPDTTRRPPPPR